MALSRPSKLLQLRNGTLASSKTKTLLKTQLIVDIAGDFQQQLMEIFRLKPTSLSRNETYFINQWKKFSDILSDSNYFALLQLYLNSRSTTKAVEVAESMISRGIKIPPPQFHQLILLGTSWKRIMSFRETGIAKDSKMIIDKMVFKYLSNVSNQMQDTHYDKNEIKAAITQVKRSITYNTRKNLTQSQDSGVKKSRRQFQNLKNFILVLIAMHSKPELSCSQIRHAMSDKFKIKISTKRLIDELNSGHFHKVR